MEGNGCVICGLPSQSHCSACGKATYCSPEHQRQDWKNHKLNCAPYKISVSDKVGRHLVATRYIPQGTIILEEKPIILGPKLYSVPICLGCYKKVDGSYCCVQCGFPMCTEQCANMAVHRDNECKIFAKKSSSPKRIENYEIPHPLYQSILPLRCLLLHEKAVDKWKILNCMEHHMEARRSRSEVWEEFQVNIVNFLRDWHGLRESYTEDTVNRVIGFIEVNSFQIKTVKKIEFCGLFRLGGLMSHDCQPNTHHAFTPEGNMILRASVNIEKGADITMSYVDPLAGTVERRQILEQSKYFGCDCGRCQDPTEFGTFVSGVKCNSFACTDGYLLPKNSLVESSPWICYSQTTRKKNSNCSNCLQGSEINQKLEKASEYLKPFLSNYNVKDIESALSLQSKFFHTNHFLLLPVWKHLLQVYNEMIPKRENTSQNNIEDLQKNKRVAEKFLSILNNVDPGLTRGRGLVLRQLYQIENQLLWYEESQCENEPTNENTKIMTKMKEKLSQLQEEIKKIFALDELIREKQP